MSPPKKCVEVPAVPEGIPYARRAVAIGLVRWRLNGDGPSPHALRVDGVSVWDINVQQAGLWLILSVGFVDFERGVADPHGSVHDDSLRRFVHAHRLRKSPEGIVMHATMRIGNATLEID